MKCKNSQGDFSCHHEDKSKMKYPLRNKVTSAGTEQDNYEDKTDIFDGTINQQGEIFALQLGKTSEELNVKISDAGSGKVYQVMKFHGSCSKPLFLGDDFNALQLGRSEELNVKISDARSGKVYRVMKFHGSCSKPLFLGDDFNALKVVELSAKHDMTSCCSSSVSK